MTRKVTFIDRPEELGPCPDCGEREICAKCKSDIASAVWYWSEAGKWQTDRFLMDLFPPDGPKHLDWWDV